MGLLQTTLSDIPDRMLARLIELRPPLFRLHNLRLRFSKTDEPFFGWGRKSSGLSADKLSARYRRPLRLIEDGFVATYGGPYTRPFRLSLIIDTLGIYYDASKPSDLERMICNDPRLQRSEVLERARSAMTRLRSARVVKFNTLVESAPPIPSVVNKGAVLVVDQIVGDASVAFGGATEETFEQMLAAAMAENPAATILVKRHPMAGRKKRRGHYDRLQEVKRVIPIDGRVSPYDVLAPVDKVYTVTSQFGFDALMSGKAVVCFGVPFYAGWGLTDDRVAVPARRDRQRSIEQLFAAAYFYYCHYVHPDSGEPCELEAILDFLELQKSLYSKPGQKFFCFGFATWKRQYIKRFLSVPPDRLHFVRNRSQARRHGFSADSVVVIWGNQGATREIEALTAGSPVPVWRMEDGFLRSLCLGSDLTRPDSLVVDRKGIYYAPAIPSDLETLLQQAIFSQATVVRADKLAALIVAAGLSKYNQGLPLNPTLIAAHPGQSIVLVVGQVESDDSVIQGGGEIVTNEALLRTVRERCPMAYLIYKPHPDVVSGNRRDSLALSKAMTYCDLYLADQAISPVLDACDEVHTITSLVGFEALIRGKRVVTYGRPFYAGWGLTEDHLRFPRRTRRLALQELVAAVLVLYPRYINWHRGTFTQPEFIVEQLQRNINAGSNDLPYRAKRLRRLLRQLSNVIKGYLGVF